ncbi:orotidine-5'-phosphate decarboxylase [soil metagenome]
MSFLCVGLDTDIHKIPPHLLKYEDPVFEFNRQIIDATSDSCVAYKINTAFYEARGVSGWQSLLKTLQYIPKDLFTIADAKRCDIGNTSELYAKAFFDPESSGFNFDALTVAPYMGEDSVKPFLKFRNKWIILLALTSNPGSYDFQHEILKNGDDKLFERVLNQSQSWGNTDNLMYVIGATRAELFIKVREIVPDHFLLVPGVGAQGGNLSSVCKYGMNKNCGLLVNSSRAIIYSSDKEDFAERAGEAAGQLQLEMKNYLEEIL